MVGAVLGLGSVRADLNVVTPDLTLITPDLNVVDIAEARDGEILSSGAASLVPYFNQ